MPTKRCGCAGEICACTITAGDGVSVTGVGSQQNPYEISVDTVATLDVTKDGNPVESGVTRINFTGVGVAVTKAGAGIVTANIPGGTAPGPAPTVSPIGTIIMWAGVIDTSGSHDPPTGWLVCNGTAIPAGTQYDALRTVLGGLTNTPDLKDRVPMGASGTKSVRSLGVGGNIPGQPTAGRIRLETNHMPQHQHAMGDHHHDIRVEWVTTAPATGGTRNVVDVGDSTGATGATVGTGDTSGPSTNLTSLSGNNDEFSILPPYTALHFLIKALP